VGPEKRGFESEPREWYLPIKQKQSRLLKGPGSLNYKKRVSASRVKKGGVCLEGVHATKKLVPRISLSVRYSPCTSTPPADLGNQCCGSGSVPQCHRSTTLLKSGIPPFVPIHTNVDPPYFSTSNTLKPIRMWRAKNAPKNSNEILILYHLSAFEAEHKNTG